MRALFAPYGVVDRITLMTDRETGRPRGLGFVEMADYTAADCLVNFRPAGHDSSVANHRKQKS